MLDAVAGVRGSTWMRGSGEPGALPAWGQGQGHSPAQCSILSSWGPRLSLGQGAPDAMAGRTLGARRAHADRADAAEAGGQIADGARRQIAGGPHLLLSARVLHPQSAVGH